MQEMVQRIAQGGLTRDEARRARKEETESAPRPQPFVFDFQAGRRLVPPAPAIPQEPRQRRRAGRRAPRRPATHRVRLHLLFRRLTSVSTACEAAVFVSCFALPSSPPDPLKSLATTSNAARVSAEGGVNFRSGPLSSGLDTYPVLNPSAFAAFKSSGCAATIITSPGLQLSKSTAPRYTSRSGLK